MKDKESKSNQPTLAKFFQKSDESSKRKRETDGGSPERPGKILLEEILQEDMSFFQDTWEDEFPERSLDLSTLKRCEVLRIEEREGLRLSVKCLKDSTEGGCRVLSPWSSLEMKPGDVISVRGREAGGEWIVSSEDVLVLHSDDLISGTTVVGSLFCTRKTVLASLMKEPGGESSIPMFVGSLVHEFLQNALKLNIDSLKGLFELYNTKVKSKGYLEEIYREGMDYSEVSDQLSTYLPSLYKAISKYFLPSSAIPESERKWKGEITEIKDIEENIWSPQLGIKGKIDLTVRVKINKTRKIMPVELKTGKSSFSVEHRGQVILYCMIMSQLMDAEVQSGLLLYLRDCQMEEIVAGEAEKRDLMMLRNNIAHWMIKSRAENMNGGLSLPPPIDHRSACSKCPYLTVCSSALAKEGVERLPEGHPMSDLAPGATSHLSQSHIDYVFQWMGLVLAERSHRAFPIWAKSSILREEEGCGVGNLKIIRKCEHENGMSQTFAKVDLEVIRIGNLSIGSYVLVSTDERFAVASGFITEVSTSSIEILLDRDLSGDEGRFHIDALPSSRSQLQISLTNLALLLDRTERSSSLRSLIVDLELPRFAEKIPSRVRRLGAEVFSRLDRDQTRSVLQVLSARSYILVKGMPGTGKTTTVRALIELLVILGKSVIVTSHTHSAVDNILVGLIGKVDFLRIGSTNRIRSDLIPFSEETFLRRGDYTSIQDLDNFYRSKNVVGVTCMGSGHFLLRRREFDYCIVDEATQVDQPTVLRPLFSASRFVLVGDPNQLSPVVVAPRAREGGFGVSLFERLERPSVTSLLALQYRMNGAIMKLANALAYEGRLRSGSPLVENAHLSYTSQEEIESKWMRKALSKKMEDSVVFIDVENPDGGENNVNKAEEKVVLEILKQLNKVSVSGSDIGVISPYRSQAEALAASCSLIDERVETNTIDQFQGRDKGIIILSCTHSSRKTTGGILSDRRRLTVAVTRARVKLILVGSQTLLRVFTPFTRLFEHIPPDNFVKFP